MIVDEDDLTRHVAKASIEDLIASFRARGRNREGGGEEEEDEAEVRRKSWRELVQKASGGLSWLDDDSDGVHAELLILTTETNQTRAETLLDLGEKALVHLLGGSDSARVSVNVVTAQAKTEAKLNLFEKGTRLARSALGLAGVSTADLEDFIASKASAEYEMLMLRFYDTELVQGAPKLTIHLSSTGRTLEVQRAGVET